MFISQWVVAIAPVDGAIPAFVRLGYPLVESVGRTGAFGRHAATSDLTYADALGR